MQAEPNALDRESPGGRSRVRPFVFLPSVLLLAVAPFLIHRDVEFKSDDWLLISRGVETGIAAGLWRNFTRPFCDTWTLEFYRPLFTWSFCLEGNLFGGDPRPYYYVNIAWHVLASLAGFLLLKRLIGAWPALIATALFASSPWSVNNLAWFAGRCSTVATFFVFAAALAYGRWVDRGRGGQPVGALVFATIGVFYRETCLFAPFLCFLLDLFEGRRDRSAFKRWVLLSLPFVVYMIAKYFVLGTLVGGYERMTSRRGPPLNETGLGDVMRQWFEVVLRLTVPGPGDKRPDWGVVRTAAAVATGLLLLNGVAGGLLKRKAFWLVLIFAAVQVGPLLFVDTEVHSGTSQRWYAALWGIAAIYAMAAWFGRVRGVGFVLLAVAFGSAEWRLHQNLREYETASRVSRKIREAIGSATADTVVVYNVRVHLGASAFFSVGLGQTQLPPFVPAAKKAAFAVMNEHRWGYDERTQSFVGLRLFDRGEAVSLLWVDYDNEVVGAIPLSYINDGRELFGRLPKIAMATPKETVTPQALDEILEFDASGIDRVLVYVHAPCAQFVVERYRGVVYVDTEYGTDGRFRMRLRDYLEFGTLLDGAAKGRTFVWVVGYDKSEGTFIPKTWSEVYDYRSVVPQEEPRRRR